MRFTGRWLDIVIGGMRETSPKAIARFVNAVAFQSF
jgi:hypothetical protein